MHRLNRGIAALALSVFAIACSQTDSGVTTSIKTKFAQDDLVQAHEINVTTQNGVVTLNGEVDSVAAHQQAVRLARETEGVTDVVDELRVEAIGTAGELEGEVDIDAGDAGRAIRKGAEETGEAIKDTGEAVKEAVTDDDPDSDRDGK